MKIEREAKVTITLSGKEFMDICETMNACLNGDSFTSGEETIQKFLELAGYYQDAAQPETERNKLPAPGSTI